jgi:DNA topoisomerase-3
MYKLVICEKPGQAGAYATILGANERKSGFFIGNGYIVTYCFGHLLKLAAPDAYGERYKKWRHEDLPIVPQQWIHVPAKDKAAQLKIIKDLLNRADVDCVVNGCDAGREGQLIFGLLYEYAKSKLPVKRLWISSMEPAAIRAGFDALKDGAEYDGLFAAASCREKADWTVGISATRLVSLLYNRTLPIGRVQSPTLAMLAKREADIAAFTPEPFYTPVIDCPVAASGGRFGDKAAAEAVRADCDGQSAVVSDVKRLQKTTAPPKLYDLTTLQREANRLLGYTAQQTLDCAQALYEKTLISYPRTDSRYLTSDMESGLPSLVNLSAMTLLPFIKVPLEVNAAAVINDAGVSDHHALIPTPGMRKANLSALPFGERDILNMIVLRLICATSRPHVYEATEVTLDCGGHSFTAKGKTVACDGWKAYEAAFRVSLKNKSDDSGSDGGEDGDDAADLPELSKGLTFESVAVSIKEGFTSPPKHHTEDTLLAAMENAGADDMPDDAERKGLGTSATRAAIIEKLIKSGLAERSKKILLPTDTGTNLIAVLPTALTSAKLTAEWEQKLLNVQRGELAADEFMGGIAAFIKAIVLENNAPKPEFANLFPSAGENAASAPSLGGCPRCGGDVTEWAKGFSCANSKMCGFKLWKENKWWTAKKKPLTAAIVTRLLKDGKAALKDLYSEKTGKTYNATVSFDGEGAGKVGQYVNFRMEFDNAVKGGRRK